MKKHSRTGADISLSGVFKKKIKTLKIIYIYISRKIIVTSETWTFLCNFIACIIRKLKYILAFNTTEHLKLIAIYLHNRKFNTAILLFNVEMKKGSLVNSIINFLHRVIASCWLRLGVNRAQQDLSLKWQLHLLTMKYIYPTCYSC